MKSFAALINDSAPQWVSEAIQKWSLAEMRRRLQLTEMRIALFLARTKLPIREVVLVRYNGQNLPQWKGAVPRSASVGPCYRFDD
jgi:hypothetical protein